jgi:triacylglycerol lipase
MPKPPPVYDARLVLNPERDTEYVHFENAGQHPFQPSPPAFPRVNVWWLAEAALLSYWDPADAIPIFNAAGLDATFITERNTDCYVVSRPDWVAVAFRGTESDEWPDILTDARFVQVPWETGKVHAGFAAAISDIWPALSDALKIAAVGRTVWFCGHSLGAALATLAADRFAGTRGVCTFGSPRVGDSEFARSFTDRFAGRSLRYVNDHDIVTHVPPPVLLPLIYQHVDLRRLIEPDGRVTSGRPVFPHFFPDLVGVPATLLDMVGAVEAGAMSHPPNFFLEHMPKAYAIWTWNDYEADG